MPGSWCGQPTQDVALGLEEAQVLESLGLLVRAIARLARLARHEQEEQRAAHHHRAVARHLPRARQPRLALQAFLVAAAVLLRVEALGTRGAEHLGEQNKPMGKRYVTSDPCFDF